MKKKIKKSKSAKLVGKHIDKPFNTTTEGNCLNITKESFNKVKLCLLSTLFLFTVLSPLLICYGPDHKSKYKLCLDLSKEFDGVTLYRIENLKTSKIGGWIASERNLSQDGDAWISDEAQVYGNAVVSNNAKVSGHTNISGNAQVSDNAQVFGSSKVFDNAMVYGNAIVSEDALVYGNAWVSDDAQISGNAAISGNVEIFGNARVYDHAVVTGNAWVFDTAIVFGSALIYDHAWISNRAQVFGNARVSGNAKIYDKVEIYGNAWIYGTAKVFGNAQITFGNITKDNQIVTYHLQYPITVTPYEITIGCKTKPRKGTDTWDKVILEQAIKMGLEKENYKEIRRVLKSLTGLIKKGN